MREEIMNLLAQALSNNLGQRLTDELATGILHVVAHGAVKIEPGAAADPAPTET